MALKAVLAPLDVSLVTATSGEEALRELLRHDFAAVLLDVQMPGMDGFETAGYIRARERSRTTPIIFVTAISKDVEHVLRGYEAGGVDYVLKPFDPAVLRSKVAVFAELERQRRARARTEALLNNALDSSPSGIALTDGAGVVVRANAALAALLGRPAERLVGHRIEELLGGVELATATTALRAGGGAPYAAELVVGGPGGEVPVAALVSAVEGVGDPQARHLFVQLWDLRDRVEAEHARERLVAERAARAEAEALAHRLANVAAITDGLDALRLADLVTELCERLAEVLGAAGAAVQALPPDRGEPAEAFHGDAGPAATVLARALREGAAAASPAGDALAVPLRANGEVLGAMAVSGVSGSLPDTQLRSLLAHAAERASLMLERARIFEREHHIASTLQRDLLPRKLPVVPGVSLTAHFHAGGDGTQVGGDWYDVIPLPGGRLGLVVGDVAGRGVAAAARMGQLRSVARAFALEGHAPGVLVQRLNQYHRALSPDDMTTLVFAVVEPDLGRLRYVNAGHPPPALVLPGEAPRLLEGSSPALGVAELSTAGEREVEFPPGAFLLLYTDGLVERRGEGIDSGLERLTTALAAPAADIETVQRNVIARCLEDGTSDDDVTALVVRAEALLGERVEFTLSPDRDALAALRRMLRRWLVEAGASDADIAAITMAANEAWQNAIEHAHAFAPVPVEVAFEHDGDDVEITVRDCGTRIPEESDPDRGRGIELMQALVDSTTLDFGSSRGGLVTLRRRISVAEPASVAS